MSAIPSAIPPTALRVEEHQMKLWDGAALFYRRWSPATPTRKALVLFHRGHEHSGRFMDVVESLGLRDVTVFAWDARGHGRSPGRRGYAASMRWITRDIDCFIRHLVTAHDIRMRDMIVLGHSVGAVTVAAWVHDYAPPLRGLVLATPALRVRLYIPAAIPLLRLLLKVRGDRAVVRSYVKAHMLTHDRQQARLYREDPLISREIAVNVLLELHDTATRLMADAAAIRVPTLLLSGSADWVVTIGAQRRLFQRLGSPDKRMVMMPGMYHDILHEKDRHLVMAECRQFIEQQFAREPVPSPLIHADREGYTRREYDRLRAPLPLWSPRRAGCAMQRAAMKSLGRLSEGIRLGWRSGFDSGLTLDYVYENQARGLSPLGQWLDRLYLNGRGWRGIRQRRALLEAALKDAIERLRRAGRPVELVDIAAGAGRYVLAILAGCNGPVGALLRDYREANLDAGRRMARQMGLDHVRFELGDAFDEASLANLQPPPNLAVVSGLYELIPENDPVGASLRGLAAAMRPGGGYLVYTNQPWHPQIEMIARVLTNREGRPWIMRRRTQAEMDDLVGEAGFEKLAMDIDDQGIFTVAMARIEGVQ